MDDDGKAVAVADAPSAVNKDVAAKCIKGESFDYTSCVLYF